MFFCFIIHDGLRRKLFLSLARKAIEKNNGIKIFCFSLAEYKWFKEHGISSCDIELIKEDKTKVVVASLDNTIDIAANFLTIENASIIYHSTINALKKLNSISEDIYIFGGNGLHAFDKAIKTYKNSRSNVFTSFSELANIEGKVFFDSTGSNASSYFYSKIKTAGFLFPDFDKDSLRKWREDYCNDKLEKHIVKQSPSKNLRKAFIHRSIGFIEFILRIPSYQRFKISELITQRKRISKKLYSVEWEKHVDDITTLKNYIFFPLQVFGDSQIKLHSSINVEQAINIVAELAREEGMELVIKPHPAESNWTCHERVIDIKQKYGFKLSTSNTFELILNANEVIVINSTVGLEAILCGKKVRFLGKTFYDEFTDDKVLNFYINHWLIDLDMFSESVINDVTFNRILDNAKQS